MTSPTEATPSETPLTDEIVKIASIEDRYLPLLRLARQLERELKQANEALAIVKQDCFNLTEKVIPNIRERLLAAEQRANHWKANHADMVQRCAALSQRPDLPVDRLPAIAKYEAMLNALQAQVDRLMIEYCPDEMSAEQIANWERHQQAVREDVDSVIDCLAALATPEGRGS